MNKKHPSFRRLSEYYDNEMNSSMKNSISQHISRCRKCSLILDSFRSYSGIVQNGSSDSLKMQSNVYLFKTRDKKISVYIKKAVNIAAVFIFIIGLSFFSMFLSEQNKNSEVISTKNTNSNNISLSKLVFPDIGNAEAYFYLAMLQSNTEDKK